MLSSQMTSVSQASKSPLLLQAAMGSSRTVIRPTSVPRCWREQQQARDFRIGFWPSHLDPNLRKAIQRRHRIIKHKYAEALNHKLAWDSSRPLYSTRWGLKSFMCTAWRGRDTRCGHRWANMDESNGTSQNSGKVGIEDVEQNAFDRLFGRQEPLIFRQKDADNHSVLDWTWHKLGSVSSNPFSPKEYKNSEAGVGNIPPWKDNSISDADMAFESEYFIDPISNRKVYRNSKGKLDPLSNPQSAEIPVKKFRGYRPQFSKLQPPGDYPGRVSAYTDKKATKTRGEHTNVGASSAPHQEETDKLDISYGKQLPHQASPIGDKLKDCGSPPPEGYSHDKGSQSLSNNELSHYKPFAYNEPDGLPPEQTDSVTRSLNGYDCQYKPFTYNEPDGKSPEQPDPVSEGLSDYDHHYTSFTFDEPDGQLAVEPMSSENVSREDPSTSASKRNFDAKSRPSRLRNSLFNKFNTTKTDKEEDLDHLRASDIRAASGKIEESKNDTTAKERRSAMEAAFTELQGSQDHHLDEAAAVQKVKESRQRAALLKFGESELLNQNSHDKSELDTKLAELDNKLPELDTKLSELDTKLSELDSKLAELDTKTPLSSSPSDLTGNFIRDFPEEFTASWGTEGSTGKDYLVQKAPKDPWGYETSPKGLELSYQKDMENLIQSAENDYTAGVTAEEYQTQTGSPLRLQTSLDRSQEILEARAQAEADPYAKEPQGLETSYVKEVVQYGKTDKPPFVSSYGCTGQSLEPAIAVQDGGVGTSNSNAKSEEKHQDQELVREIRDIYESAYGAINCKHRQDHMDGLPTPSTDKSDATGQSAINLPWQEDVSNVSGAHMAGNEPLKERLAVGREEIGVAVAALPSSAAQQPTQYKILAYDPTMQEINIAETASTAADSSSALTPAEVLLRLSNPAKFFPHFQPLQEQGYEIVSGSGDVLVFRKVRDADPNSPRGTSASSTTTSTLPRPRKVVNPIDGMQSIPQPATGNFASPTGFVNHDLPSEPPFVSKIDVRREEPVFSSHQTAWPEEQWDDEPPSRKTRHTGRELLIGAAWVAACSYAVGVVSEFFKTGGSDGKGPVGF
jgi:hypothetical protein